MAEKFDADNQDGGWGKRAVLIAPLLRIQD
jgi:hypothetical protein